MKCAQHADIIPNSKRWNYSDIPGSAREKIKGPAPMVEGDHHLRKDPKPPPTTLGSDNDLVLDQRTIHYLIQLWPTSISPYGVTGSQWVKLTVFKPTMICWLPTYYGMTAEEILLERSWSDFILCSTCPERESYALCPSTDGTWRMRTKFIACLMSWCHKAAATHRTYLNIHNIWQHKGPCIM